MPVSLKLSPWICTFQLQCDTGGKGARQRNRQPSPDSSGEFYISSLDHRDKWIGCMPPTFLSHWAIYPLERGFFFCTCYFAFKNTCLYWVLPQLGSDTGWRFANIWMPIKHSSQALLSQNHVSGIELKQNQGMTPVTMSIHIQIRMHEGTHSWANWISLHSVKRKNIFFCLFFFSRVCGKSFWKKDNYRLQS